MLLARTWTPAGARVARVKPAQGALLPPGAARIPGVDDPPLEASAPLEGARLLPPVRPGKILCIGRNYRAHAEELGNAVPGRPLLFLKPPSALLGPGQVILLPPDSQRVEHEAELALIIGRRCRHVDEDQAMDFVAGVVALNDVTARDLQRADKQFARGKGFDTFCPVGPWVALTEGWVDRQVRCRVNGELRQDGHTSLMMFPPPRLVAELSRIMTLEPGDLIATGTPAGVGPLLPGDRVEVEIEGVGALINAVERDPVSAGAG